MVKVATTLNVLPQTGAASFRCVAACSGVAVAVKRCSRSIGTSSRCLSHPHTYVFSVLIYCLFQLLLGHFAWIHHQTCVVGYIWHFISVCDVNNLSCDLEITLTNVSASGF